MQPTSEQQQVIDYSTGHALVFAVAGSGKTATMVERILHLIRDEAVRPSRILACTFSREAVRVIEARLAPYPETKGVSVCTLHALAFRVIQEAIRMGLTDLRTGESGFARKIFEAARRQLIEENPEERNAYFNIKYDDFYTYMGVQKGNLALPFIPDDVPEDARALISEPDRGVELYADLYERYEQIRRTQDLIDFDDTIVEAALLLMRFTALREVMQGKWDYANVDEFQDVNLAQSEMLHLLTRKCRSYVAIGDDDQTIYQWRGANPRFILGFSERYQAKEFTLSTNFRCPMGVIALSEQVIRHNEIRSPKRMKAALGGNGVHIHEQTSSNPGLAAHVAIQAIKDGRPPRDIVILVRTYAQTGEIERVFIEQDVPYAVVGGVPFYLRHEVAVLLAYLRLAMADLDAQRGIPLSPKQRRDLMQDWQMVANIPNRYLRREMVQSMTQGVWQGNRTLSAALMNASADLRGNAQNQVFALARALSDLTDDLALAEGKDALLNFAESIGYANHLIRTAPTREFGEERTGSIRALAEMAATRSLGELLEYITGLMQQGQFVDRYSAVRHDDVERVTIMTAFRAKGLEWPMIIVPGCTEGLYRIKPMADKAAAEEERRVFYVAMTRTKEELHLILGPDGTTEFLTAARYEEVVHGHTRLAQLMGRDPKLWSGRDTLEAATLLQRYGHEHFVQQWLDSGYRERLLRRVYSLQEALSGKLDWGQEAVANILSLQQYEAQGQLSLAEDDTLRQFLDLDQLVNMLHQQYEVKASQPVGAEVRSGQYGMSVTPDQIIPGMIVKHAKFGAGRVISIRGSGQRVEAEIQFDSLEAVRRMVVAYANLQHADETDIDDPVIWPPVPKPMGGYWAAQPSSAAVSPRPPTRYDYDDEVAEEDLPF